MMERRSHEAVCVVWRGWYDHVQARDMREHGFGPLPCRRAAYQRLRADDDGMPFQFGAGIYNRIHRAKQEVGADDIVEGRVPHERHAHGKVDVPVLRDRHGVDAVRVVSLDLRRIEVAFNLSAFAENMQVRTETHGVIDGLPRGVSKKPVSSKGLGLWLDCQGAHAIPPVGSPWDSSPGYAALDASPHTSAWEWQPGGSPPGPHKPRR